MKLQLVPPRTGLLWVRLGARVFWRQPMALTALFMLCLGCMSLVTMLPVIGTVLALAMIPTVTLVMMVASAQTHLGKQPAPAILMTALRSGRERGRDLVVLGLLYAGCFLLVLGLSALIDGGDFARVYVGTAPLTKELALSPEFEAAMWLAVLLYLPLSVLFWHAPGLVHWWGVSPVKAMFFSTIACMRNLGAFTLYGLGWTGLFMATGVVISLVLTMLSEMGMSPNMTASLLVITAIVLATMFFVSVVFSFRDCFEPSEPAPATTGEADISDSP